MMIVQHFILNRLENGAKEWNPSEAQRQQDPALTSRLLEMTECMAE